MAGLVLLEVACVGVPTVLAIATESIRIPHFDDWSYTNIALGYFESGDIRLVGSNAAMLFGQFAWARPFAAVLGETVRSLNVAGAAAAATGLLGAHLVARRFLRVELALLVTALIGFFPAFGALVPTFMTDHPAFAAQMLSLALGLAALDRSGRARGFLLVAGLTVGVFGFTIREISLAAPVAILIAWGADRVRNARSIAAPVATAGAVACACGALYLWRHSFPGDTPPGEGAGFTLGPSLVVSTALALFTLAVGSLPAVALVARESWAARRSRRWRVGACAAALLALLAALYPLAKSGRAPDSLFLGYVFHMRGPWGNQALLGERPMLFAPPVWVLLNVAGLIAGILLVGHCARRLMGMRLRRELERPNAPQLLLLVVYAGATLAVLLAFALVGGATYERYLWGIALVLLILLLRPVPVRLARVDVVAAGLALLAVAGVSYMVVGGGHAYDSARWRAGEEAIQLGAAPGAIDAGLEWVGFHYRGRAHEKGIAPRWRPPARRYMEDFPRARNCMLASNAPLTDRGLVRVKVIEYRQPPFGRTRELSLYRNPAACAAASGGGGG